jgi:hypothetical protein
MTTSGWARPSTAFAKKVRFGPFVSFDTKGGNRTFAAVTIKVCYAGQSSNSLYCISSDFLHMENVRENINALRTSAYL